MSDRLELFLTLDLPALAAGVLAATACAIVGCFLVLRKMSLMGDAISHAALPGLVAALLISGSNHTLPMLTGAIIVGVLTTALTELIHRAGRLEQGASMGVVFTALFAVGVIMLERAAGRNVHLDADCVLYGQMEDVTWLNAPATLAALGQAASWEFFPRELITLGAALAAVLLMTTLLYKELKITSFDPALAATQGIHPALLRYLLMTVTAIVTVASFEAVGSILVVAMLIAPAMVAHLLTDRLSVMIALSALVAIAASVSGYLAGALAPGWLGAGESLSAAGMIGVTLGVFLALAALFAPRHGRVSRWLRRRSLAAQMAREDALAALFRAGERGAVAPIPDAVLRSLIIRGDAQLLAGRPSLTPAGEEKARRLVRSHRLWERFLVDRMGLRPDHVHQTAERLEHVTDQPMQQDLAAEAPDARDPHGRPIP